MMVDYWRGVEKWTAFVQRLKRECVIHKTPWPVIVYLPQYV